MADLPATGTARSSPALQAGVSQTSRDYLTVWSRTAPRYRVRAVVLLITNLLLFCGLCVFTHWLHVGRPFDFSLASYLAPFRFWGTGSPNLNDFILFPIDVTKVPMHAVVLGLLLGAIVGVPIVVAILYRFVCAVPFLLAVFLLAHMPWMAITLTGSCILAAVRPFRLNFRFGSALLGLLPVLLYLYLATRGGSEQAGVASPTEKLLLAAPWIMAVLAAAAMMGLALLIARIVNFRPGPVAPTLALMFLAPVLVFHAKVGTDELAYRVLEANYGPRSPRFEPVRNAEPILRHMLAELLRDDALYEHYRDDLLRVLAGDGSPMRRLARYHLLQSFMTDRAEAYEACRRFISDYPRSRYIPNVLYIQARVLDTRLDERALDDDPPRRALYDDYPHVQSESVWLKLLTGFPDSPLTLAAGVRLAELHLRRGEVAEARALLERVLRREQPRTAGAATQPSLKSLLARAAPEASLEFQPEPFRRAARTLLDLIDANADDPRYGDRPLRDFMRLDPRRPGYAAALLRLAQQYRDGLLMDNLMVAWAETLTDPLRRAAALEACIRRFPKGDALPQALFRLADLEIQTLGADDPQVRRRGIRRLRRLVRDYGQTTWGRQAAERLAMVAPQTARSEP